MSMTSTTKTIIKAKKPPYRTAAGELVPQEGILDVDGPGIDMEDDEKGDFLPVPLQDRQRRPSHPGRVLANLYLPRTGLTQGDLADRLGVSRRTINMIINGSRPVTVDMAMRLARAFGTSAQLWLNLQRDCDLWDAAHTDNDVYQHIQRLECAV